MRPLLAYARNEFRSTITRGEGLLVTFLAPLGVIVFFSKFKAAGIRPRPLSFLVPGTVALAIIASSFVSLSIATAFERRYGVLKRLGVTPLGRRGLISGKILATMMVLLLQVAALIAVAFVLGWEWEGKIPQTILLVMLGSITFGSLGLWMAGRVRAEATLAFSNLGFLLAMFLGGIAYPIDDLPDTLHRIASYFPPALFTEGLRSSMNPGNMNWNSVLGLLLWAVVGMFGAMRYFQWEE